MSVEQLPSDLDHARERLFFYGLDPDDFERELLATGGDVKAALRSLLAQRAEAGDVSAAVGMVHAAVNAGQRRRWLLLTLQSQMDEWRTLGHELLEVQAPPCMSCERCAPLHGSLVPSASQASELVPADCPRMGDRRCCVHLRIAPSAAESDPADEPGQPAPASGADVTAHPPPRRPAGAPSHRSRVGRWWAALVGRRP